MRYYFVDLETTARGGPDGKSPEAHWRDNEVLLCGWHVTAHLPIINDTVDALCDHIADALACGKDVCIVAHNAKFDLKYLMRDRPDIDWYCVHVWDTMTWEYLNSGHREIFISLEDAAAKCSIPFTKSLDLGALLSSGVQMEDIPKDDLSSYLEGDVEVLSKLHAKQLARGSVHWMGYLLPLAEMELNGLKLDSKGSGLLTAKLMNESDKAFKYICTYIMDNCKWQDGTDVVLNDFSNMVYPKSKCINATANRTLSMLLTGTPSECKITNKWKLSLKGQPILNNKIVSHIYNYVKPTHVGYPMSEDDIDIITATVGELALLQNLMKHRKGTKIVNTYLLPMRRQMIAGDGVYPKLNTAVTSTGRLSSSEPNGQNMPEIVRELCVSIDDKHVLEEIDYSQLELVGAASLSGDLNLIYDLNHGVDIHKNTATKVFGADKADEKRKLAKNVNFGVLYGGKAGGLSKQTGVDKATIQQLIKAFYDAYPGVATWQRSLFETVVDHMVPHDVKNGEQRYRSDYVLPQSGRKFRFIETEAPDWIKRKTGRGYSFSPNHTANYPIQGFAGGDIVMFGLWYLWRELRAQFSHDEVQFRMTVHDSVLLERKLDIDLQVYYDNMIDAICKRFNLPVKLHVDVESGFNWR